MERLVLPAPLCTRLLFKLLFAIVAEMSFPVLPSKLVLWTALGLLFVMLPVAFQNLGVLLDMNIGGWLVKNG